MAITGLSFLCTDSGVSAVLGLQLKNELNRRDYSMGGQQVRPLAIRVRPDGAEWDQSDHSIVSPFDTDRVGDRHPLSDTDTESWEAEIYRTTEVQPADDLWEPRSDARTEGDEGIDFYAARVYKVACG